LLAHVNLWRWQCKGATAAEGYGFGRGQSGFGNRKTRPNTKIAALVSFANLSEAKEKDQPFGTNCLSYVLFCRSKIYVGLKRNSRKKLNQVEESVRI
jgi:hypothetical protein